jgi:serine/threonine protein kinase
LDHDASQEIEALQKCQDHINIVKMEEVLQDKQFKYIVFELLSGGELFSRIQKSGFLTEDTALIYFKQIVDAVKHMHSKGIIHKDLKPGKNKKIIIFYKYLIFYFLICLENILFVDDADNSEELRIVDFGFAQKSSSEESPPCFTLDYAAPESLVRGETKASRDLWALGVILYTMLVGNTPFKPIASNTNATQDDRNFRMQVTENIRNGENF